MAISRDPGELNPCNPSTEQCSCQTETNLDCEELVTDVCVDTKCEEEICILSSVGCPPSIPPNPCQRSTCDPVKGCNADDNTNNGGLCDGICCSGECCEGQDFCLLPQDAGGVFLCGGS